MSVTPRASVFAVAALALGLGAAPALAQGSGLQLELNAMEPTGGGCRLTFVANNATTQPLLQLSYDVVVFDAVGTVSDRLILEFGRLQAGRTRVVQFQLERECTQISRLLLNEAQDCTVDGGMRSEMCIDALVAQSRAGAQFGL